MRRLLVPLVVLLAISFVITGCTTASTTPSASTLAPIASMAQASPATPTPLAAKMTAVSGGTLRWIAGIGPGTPIGVPWEAAGGTAFTMQLCQQFLVNEQVDSSLTPNLAASYDVVTDPANPSITFHLQTGVKFSDGTDFNAQAVQWNLQQEMTSTSTNINSTTDWKSIVVVDDYTLRVNLKTWQNTQISNFGGTAGYMISPTAFQKNGITWMESNMVGTGPFMQTNYQRDVSLTTTRNPNYWEQGKPYLDGVQLLYVADMMTSEAMMKSGEADVLDCQGDGRIANDMQAAGFKILSQPGGGLTALAPDSLDADSPWSNLKVRQAAEYAIDKDSLAKTFGFGYAQGADQLLSPSSPGYDTNLTPRPYDVAKAKQLLTEAGYPTGFKTTLIVAPFGLNQDMIVAIQAYLAAVGIQCDMQFPQAAQAMAYLTGPSPHNALIYNPIMEFANPNSIFSFYLNEPKPFGYQSTKHPTGWADLLNATLTAPKLDPALARKCEDALYNDTTFIPLTISGAPFALASKVQDSGIGTRGSLTFWEPGDSWFSP